MTEEDPDDDEAWSKAAVHACAVAAAEVLIAEGVGRLVNQITERQFEIIAFDVIAKFSELAWQRREKLKERVQESVVGRAASLFV